MNPVRNYLVKRMNVVMCDKIIRTNIIINFIYGN